jgi:CheY-like chemotaxis protein
MLNLKEGQKQLKGKTLLFIYDNPIKRDMVEEVFVNARMNCKRIYAHNVEKANILLQDLKMLGITPDLIVTDYDLSDDVPNSTAKTGGEFFEALRSGQYDPLLPNARTMPVIFDSGAEAPERYRGQKNVFIRALGTSLPLTCAAAIRHYEQSLEGDNISRKRSFYPSSANMRDMTPEYGGHIGNDGANMQQLKLVQHWLDSTQPEAPKGRGK